MDETYDHLTRTRFWWLPGTDTAAISSAVDRIFDEHEIDVIAPAFGCPLVGEAVVGRHRERLREVLTRAATARSSGIEAGRWNR